MLLARRSFLWGLVAAPAIVRVASIMPVSVFDLEDWALEEDALAFRGGGCAFTAAEIQNLANAAMDFYLAPEKFYQTIQNPPFWKKLSPMKKTFPGGNGGIKLAVTRPWRT